MTGVVFIDVGFVPVNGSNRISALTWVMENKTKLYAHHYFVNYPGAKSLERQITDIVGGQPLVRYSSTTVLNTFFADTKIFNYIACKNDLQKEVFSAQVKKSRINHDKQVITFHDFLHKSKLPLQAIRLLSLIDSKLQDTKEEAALTFGNSI